MSNDLHIKKRMKVVKEKMDKIIRKITRDYEMGRIKTKVELQHRITHDLQKFYDSIGDTTLQVVEAWGPPYSSDHNQMIQQIYQDIITLYEEITNITTDLAESFEQVELERQSFEKRISESENIVKGVQLNIAESFNSIIFRDHFADIEQYDKDATELVPAHLSTGEGLLTLNRIESENFNMYASIRINSGNGLPGNSRIVRSTGQSLKFDGEDGLHINLADMLDENADTWFEYEAVQITDSVRAKIEGKGLSYKEPVDWAKQLTEGLALTIEINIAKPKSTNWISLVPFIPQDKGATAAILDSIEVSDGKGTVHRLVADERFDASRGFLFPRLSCKTVHIRLRQPSAYDINVGHLFFKQANTEDISVLNVKTKQEGVLVSGTYPSVTNLGVLYDTGKQEIIYPEANYGDTIIDEEQRKIALFTPPVTSSNIHAGIEQIPAQRYMIGIRDTSIASYKFAPESEYVSRVFVSDKPIKEVTLDVDYDIPKQFPVEEEWVEFYVSFDNKKTWNRIYTQNVYQDGVKTKYLINSATPNEARLNEVGYIESLSDVLEVHFRIILKRPISIDDANFYTPVIYGYELHVLTQGENN